MQKMLSSLTRRSSLGMATAFVVAVLTKIQFDSGNLDGLIISFWIFTPEAFQFIAGSIMLGFFAVLAVLFIHDLIVKPAPESVSPRRNDAVKYSFYASILVSLTFIIEGIKQGVF